MMELFGYWAAYVVVSTVAAYFIIFIAAFTIEKFKNGLVGALYFGALCYFFSITVPLSWLCLGFYMIGSHGHG